MGWVMLPGMSRAAVTSKGRVLRHPGDLQWLERRRLQAADLFTQGKTRAEVAGELRVSAQTASRWYGRWRDGGTAGLRTARQGKPAQLGPTELAKIRRVLDDLLPATWHRTDQYGNNRIECDHGRLKARLRPMRGLKRDRSATVVVAGHALVQNLRRDHYELAVEEPGSLRVAAAFDELALAI